MVYCGVFYREKGNDSIRHIGHNWEWIGAPIVKKKYINTNNLRKIVKLLPGCLQPLTTNSEEFVQFLIDQSKTSAKSTMTNRRWSDDSRFLYTTLLETAKMVRAELFTKNDHFKKVAELASAPEAAPLPASYRRELHRRRQQSMAIYCVFAASICIASIIRPGSSDSSTLEPNVTHKKDIRVIDRGAAEWVAIDL